MTQIQGIFQLLTDQKIFVVFLFSDDNYNKVENDFINLFNNSKNNSLFQKMTNFDIKYFLPSLLHVEDR